MYLSSSLIINLRIIVQYPYVKLIPIVIHRLSQNCPEMSWGALGCPGVPRDVSHYPPTLTYVTLVSSGCGSGKHT